MANFFVVKRCLQCVGGLGAAVASSYGAYQLLSSQPEKYLPPSKRGISASKGKYKQGSFAQKMIEGGSGNYYLGTGAENKDLWKKTFDNWKKETNKWSKLNTVGITSAFADGASDVKTLNGYCEKNVYEKSDMSNQMSWICMPSFAHVVA